MIPSKCFFPVKSKQGGFGMLSVLVGTVLLLGATVAVVATTRGSLLSSDSSTAQAAGVIAQASSLATAAELVVTRGAVPLTSVTFDTSSTTGLFAPALTGISPPPLLPQVMATDAYRGTRWQLGRAVAIKSFGQDTAAEVAFYLAGVSSTVCAAVNKSITGSVAMGITADTAASVPPTSDGTVGTLQQLFAASSAVTLPIATSTVQPAGAATPLILAFTTSPAAGAVGCFILPNAGTPINVVYAVAQTN